MRNLLFSCAAVAVFAAASISAGNAGPENAPASASTSAVDCARERVTCGTLKTCKQACGFLHQCSITALDRDKDGIPCESLCQSACDAPS